MEYGKHPTRYEQLSNDQLYSMYREASYSRLNADEKLDLLQETVNHDAMERGELGAPEVRFADLPAHISGNAANGIINVNREMAVNGVQNLEYKGQIISHNISDYNVQSLNTVLHENTHCWQDQVIDGTIHIDNVQLTNEYQANAFTSSAVLLDGRYQLGSQYLSGETANGYHLYYFQATERDAYLSAENKTDMILNGLTTKYGSEPSFAAYAKSVDTSGYQAREKEAVELFQNPDFVKDLNQTLQNQYFGTNILVDKNTENAVKAEMIATFNGLQQNNSINKEDSRMSFDPKPVSLEEYNQSLRDAVNAYYEHALNDSSMSQEEVIQTTLKATENYLNAVEKFQNAQNVQAENAISENTPAGVQADNTVGENVSASVSTVDSVDMQGEETTDITIDDNTGNDVDDGPDNGPDDGGMDDGGGMDC